MYNSLKVVETFLPKSNADEQDIEVQFLIVHFRILGRDVSQFNSIIELMTMPVLLGNGIGDVRVD